jgi:hypothetical protein
MKNVPAYNEISSIVPTSGGNSKDLFLKLRQEKSVNIDNVPGCSSFSSIKQNRNKNIENNNIEGGNNIYREKNREGTGNEGTNLPDVRFKSETFRSAVRTVLQHFGYENPKFKDFKEVEQKFTVDGRARIDWLEFADRIVHPRFDATVFVLDAHGRRIFSPRGVVKKGITLFGDSRDEALKTLNTKYYEFEHWFDFPEESKQKTSGDVPF